MSDRRLHADANQAVSVIDRLPRVDGEFAAAIVGVAIITHIQLGAMVRQHLNHIGATLVRGAVQRGSPGVGLRVHVETEIDQHLDGFERGLLRPLVSDPFHPANARGHVQRRDAEESIDLGSAP